MLMRRTVAVLILVTLVAMPAAGQFREAVPPVHSSTRLYQASGALGSVMSKIFNPSVFRMSHAVELSAGTFGGSGYSTGMYTNTMAWRFSDRFSMRADVAVAYSPQNQALTALGFERNGPRVFLRNAEVAWKPSEKFRLNIQVRQDPYRNRYMSPFGSYYGFSPYRPYWQDRWR